MRFKRHEEGGGEGGGRWLWQMGSDNLFKEDGERHVLMTSELLSARAETKHCHKATFRTPEVR